MKHTLREHLHVHSRRQPIFIADQAFELPFQLSSITLVLEIANVQKIILMKQDNDDTNWEISINQSDVGGESTLSSNIEDDDLGNRLKVLHLAQACCDKTIRTTRVPLPSNGAMLILSLPASLFHIYNIQSGP